MQGQRSVYDTHHGPPTQELNWLFPVEHYVEILTAAELRATDRVVKKANKLVKQHCIKASWNGSTKLEPITEGQTE